MKGKIAMEDLTIGQTLYERGRHGNMYPVKILEIDLVNRNVKAEFNNNGGYCNYGDGALRKLNRSYEK